MQIRTILPLLLLTLAAPAAGDGLDLAGFIAAEGRFFAGDPLFADQDDDTVQPSLIFEPEFRWRKGEGRQRVRIVPFLRLDGRDDERTHFDLREASWLYIGDGWEILVGVDKVFWGVTESRHLVDVINQTDAVEDVDEEDKLGQPMIRYTRRGDWGTLDVFALTGFRERTFPGREGRLRGPLPVADDAVYESSAEDGHIDVALRWSHYVGAWDLGASYFHGTGREPRLLPSSDGDEFIAHYDLIHQVGVDVQNTTGAWLWKFEGIVREGQGETFGAYVAGFEYTLFQIARSSSDLGLLFEVLYDGRDAATVEDGAPPTTADDDFFVGVRWAINDVQDTSVLAGAIIDRDNGSTAMILEAERRLGQRLTLEVEGRFFFDAAPTGALGAVADDDVLTVRLSRHF